MRKISNFVLVVVLSFLAQGCLSSGSASKGESDSLNAALGTLSKSALEIPFLPGYDFSKTPTARLLFEEIDDIGLESEYKSCSPDVSKSVSVKVFKYKYSMMTDDELVVVAYLPDTNAYVSANSSAPSQPAVAMFHGGGHNTGNPIEYFSRLGPRLASHGIVALGFQYRLGKVHGTTRLQASQDALSAIRWMDKNADKLGIDKQKIMTLGMSAGGHLADLMAYLSARGDATISDDDYGPIPQIKGAVAFYPMSRVKNIPLVSPFELSESDLQENRSLNLKLRIHMAEYAIPAAGEPLSEPDKLNEDTVQFCNNVNLLGGDCVMDITEGATHNFADQVEFFSSTLSYLEADIQDILGINVNFSDDDSSASKACFHPSEFESKWMLYIERRKFYNYVCNQYKYSKHEYCYDNRFTKFMSEPMKPMQAQIHEVRFFKNGQEVQVSENLQPKFKLEEYLNLKDRGYKFAVVVPDVNIPGDYVYAPSNHKLGLNERLQKREGEIQFVRKGTGLLEVFSSPMPADQIAEFDQIRFSVKIVNGDVLSNLRRPSQATVDETDPSKLHFDFVYTQAPEVQQKAIYMGVLK